MALINFFLRFCVLHDESQVFPSRMACTPWQLSHAVEKRVVGFSGTKDNHFLLPAHVHQASPEDIRLLATDGKMLSLLLGNDEHTPCYYPLNPTVRPVQAQPSCVLFGGSAPSYYLGNYK